MVKELDKEKQVKNLTVEELEDKIFENPYYPLNGPPRNREEKTKLAQVINNERENFSKAFQAVKIARQDIDSLARSLCADLELDYQLCSNSSSLWNRMTACAEKKNKLTQCLLLQKVGFLF